MTLAPSRNQLYGWRWRKARRRFLTEHPLCVYCANAGRSVAASVVDHITPHRGDAALFWDETNWQPLCKRHHDATKQAEEKNKSQAFDENGFPIGQDHHWNDS